MQDTSVDTTTSEKKHDRSEKQKSAKPESSCQDSRAKEEKVEAVLRQASKEMAAVLLLMPPIASCEKTGGSVKTKDSFDTSFSSLDSDEETIEDWLDELEEELVGLHLLPQEE